MDRTQELSDVNTSTQTEETRLISDDRDPLSYHATEFQGTDRLRHAHTTASVDLSIDAEGSSGEPFLFVPSPEDDDPTGQALEQCKKWVLEPYRCLLKGLGWVPFTRDQDGDSVCLKVKRGFLILFWLGVITAGFISQIITCFRRDTIVPGTNITDGNRTFNEIMCEKHFISFFVLLDILLVASYFFPFYLFSRGETEYLSTLAETAFIKNSETKDSNRLNRLLTRTMIFFIVLGVSWIFLSFVVRILTALSVRLFTNHTVVSWSSFVLQGPLKLALIILSLFGFLFFDVLYVAVVLNHAAQCEMNIHLLRAIGSLVTMKLYDSLDAAMKDIMECRRYLRVLNGKTAAATALVLFNLGSAAIVSLITLDGISRKPLQCKTLATATAGLNSVLWIALISFPFIQAARVTYAAKLLKETGPEIRVRPMQYINTSQLELDSYLQLTQAVRLRATMFGIPIYPWTMYAVLVAFTFTMLVLFQFQVYNFTVYL